MLGSGVAALHAVFFTFLRTGDHVIVADVSYEAPFKLFTELLTEKYGIEASFVDISDLDAVRAGIRPNTRLVHIEAIANPTTKVTDVAAVAAIAHEAGALLSVDSTFTPPPLFRPLDHGADLVVHSLTKYINGHGDAMGGAVIGRRELIQQIKTEAMVDVGGVISPFNAWLIMRGSVTLPLRLRQQWPAPRRRGLPRGRPAGRLCHVPGAVRPQPTRAALSRLSGGFGGGVSFAIGGTHTDRLTFVNDLRVITSAVSLGHDETYWSRTRSTPRVRRMRSHGRSATTAFVRLAVGLEAVEDLIADLDASLTTAYGPR